VQNISVEMMLEYCGFLRMIHLWFHGAHHLTSGQGFAGDHVNLYGKIYTEVQDQVDAAIEKAVGLFGEECGDPLMVTRKALEIMSEYPSPIEQNPAGIAAVGLQIERDYLKFSKSLYVGLKKSGELSLGLDDFIMANSSAHETFVYLLQRRVKSEVEM
jgi:hypothetical protein